MSRTVLQDMPPEDLDRMEAFAARSEAREETWGDLADSVARKLKAAGFQRHHPYSPRGGFHLSSGRTVYFWRGRPLSMQRPPSARLRRR